MLRLGTALGAAASQPVLATDFPLTDVSVRDVLALDTALGARVAAAVTATSPDSLDALAGIISGDSALTMTQLTTLSDDAPIGSTEWDLDIDLPGAVPVPLRYEDERLTFGAAELSGELVGTLTGTVRLRFDPNALALRQFSVVGESVLTTHVWTRPVNGSQTTGQPLTVPSFPIVDGFVETAGAGTATIDTTSSLRLRDPNGRGAVTTEDLQFGTPEELFALLTGPGADDVDIDIDLYADLLDAATHGTVSVGTRPAAFTDTYAPVVLSRDADLDRLTSLTRAQAVSGFAQFIAALLAAEGSVDAAIPLLDAQLTDVFSPGEDLLDLLASQAVATITCGAADTLPPTGAPRPGQVRYCQAVTDGFTAKAGTTPVWSSPETGVTFAGATADTVGTSPTDNVEVTGGGGFPRLVVTFTGDDDETRTARSLVRSIQELGSSVAGIGLGGTVTYDATNQSLEIATTVATADHSVDVATGGTGSLAPLTGLAGLCQAEPGVVPRTCPRTGDTGPTGTTSRVEPAVGQATLAATDRELSATFGIGLVSPATTAVDGEDAPPEPVTYLKPAADGVLWEIDSLTATLPTDAPLVARIGFLQVDVDVTAYSLTSSGAAAQVTVPTGPVTLAGGTVSGAVEIVRLLGADPAQGGATTPVSTTATRGLSATATLAVEDAPDANLARLVDASGTVDATWTDLSPGAFPTIVTGGDYDRLRLLDLVPSQRGVAGSGSTGATLVDPIADFHLAFGLDATSTDRSVTRTLHDLDAPRDTDATSSAGTTCTEFTVVDAHTLTCTDGPLASGGLAAGHAYAIEGDPTALRDVLIENLGAVLSVFATPDPVLEADDTLPLVDLRPDQISEAQNTMGQVIATLQAEAAADTGTADVSTLQGFAGAVARVAPGSVTSLTLGATDLQIATSLAAPSATVFAPLRASAGDNLLNIVDGVDTEGLPATVTLPLLAESSVAVEVAVDLTEGSALIGKNTKIAQMVTGLASADAQVQASLAGKAAEYGATTATTGEAADIAAGIALDVQTAPAATASEWIPLPDFRASLLHERTRGGETDQDCGGGATKTDAAACLLVPLVDDASAVLTTVAIALEADESSGGSGAGLDDQPLAYRFLGDGLGAFSRTLAQSLDGDILDVSLPLVGTDLDAGADIPGEVDAYAGAVRLALTSLNIAETERASTLQVQLSTAITAVDVPDVTDAEVTVAITCATACDEDSTVADVIEIRAPIELSGNKTGETAPFRPGLAGVALTSDLLVPTTTDWTLTTTIGILRGSGPFVVAEPTGTDTTVGVLSADVTAELPSYSSADCHLWDRAILSKAGEDTAVTVPASGTGKCIDAFVGKLPSVLVDTGSTGLDAKLSLSVAPGIGTTGPADAEGRVYLPALFDRLLPTTLGITGTGGLDLYFEGFASEIGFFDVVGTIDQTWTDGAYGDLAFGHLEIDAETVYDILDFGYAKAKKYLAPLNPVVDVLSAPIPVASELAGMVGQPPVTLLSLLARANQNLAMVLNVIGFQQFVARLPGSGDAPELVDLGSGNGGTFNMPAMSLRRSKCTKTVAATPQGGKAFTAKSSGTGSSDRCDESAASKVKRKINGEKAPKDPTAGKNIQKQTTKSTYFALPTIAVPVLEDAKQVYDLLLGQGDTTLLYVDLGHIGGEVSMVRNFGPLMIGPVPVVASIGGTIGIDGRFAFGFDTHGLTKAIETLDPGDVGGLTGFSRGQVFSEGFFIDDLEAGVDVPEIKLTFTITAGAAVSIGFADAGIKGGVVLDLSLDAFDPDGDGRIYTDEFAGTDSGPDCVFNVSSGLTFFLQFYFHIDLFLFHVDKAFDIVRSPRLTLFEFNCELVQPTLAYLDDNDDLWLTMGSKVGSRNAYAGTTKESYTVRQLGTSSAGTLVEVSAFSLVQTFTVPTGGRILADASSDADVVRLHPGQIPTTVSGATVIETVPFTLRAVIASGEGDDKITTGDGADVVNGGAGNDTIKSGAGDDVVNGDAGIDLIDGEAGQDQLNGGLDDDRVSGGAGGDLVTGGAGDDVLDGGPGALPSQLFPTTDPTVIGALLDSGDLVVGGGGSDTVTGGDGSDTVVGGDFVTTGAAFTGVQNTTVFGVTQTGKLSGIAVTTPTLVLPTLTSVRAECALVGAVSGTDRDEVTGGPARDYVVGGGGADTLAGGGGSDLVCGRGGADLLVGDGSDVTDADEGADELLGGGGADRLYGSGGVDVIRGDEGDDLLRGGDGGDDLAGGVGSDLLLGEAGLDTLQGDGSGTASTSVGDARLIVCLITTSVIGGGMDLNGDLSANTLDDGRLEGLTVTGGLVYDVGGVAYTGLLGDVVFQAGRADLDGNGTADDTGVVELAGITGAVGDGDCLLGGAGADVSLDGQHGGDYVDGGDGDDPIVRGGTGADLVRGGAGDDVVRGDADNDLITGDGGADLLVGNTGDDVLRGGSGADRLIGGSETASAVDGRDELLGDGGDDVLAGGNATMLATTDVTSAIPGRVVSLLATPSSGDGLDDQLFAGFGDDWAFGQEGDDLVGGGHDDDVVEGGPGADTVHGDDGDDLAIGGSSTAGAVTPTRSGTGIADGADTVHGDAGVDDLDGDDIVVGDNARLDPEPATGGVDRERWPTIRPGASILIFDVDAKDSDIAALSGGDILTGGGGDDLLLGQHGNDTISGGDGDDAIEGDAGADIITGDAGDDALVGGGSTLDGDVRAGSVGDGLSDGIDDISGGAGDDVIAGDNARLQAEGDDRGDGTALRTIRLYDVETDGVDPAGAGDDLAGGTGRDLLFGQGGDDTVNGGDDDDALEGNAGDDTLYGGGGEDDLIGGGSTTNGLVITKVADILAVPLVSDRLLQPVTGTIDASAAGMHDGDDVLYGGDGPVSAGGQADGADVLLGDNGRITRDGTTITGGLSGVHDVRHVAMADETAGPTSGSDLLAGQAGDDELYGQFDDTDDDPTVGGGQSFDSALVEGDVLLGGPGDDALIGDQGVDVPTPAGDLGKPETLRDKTKFVSEPVRKAGSLIRVVTLTQPALGGDDVLLGGAGRDAIHAGAGADLANGGDNDDALFGADGSDALWGGLGHDILFAGDGADFLDIKKRTEELPLWVAVAPDEDTDGLRNTVNGMDTTYGGLGPDAAQADVGDHGRTDGDRLIDWTGVFNLYLVCDGAYGAGKVQNRPSPGMSELLIELASSWGSVGGGELALVESGDTSPKYPGAPGNFACEEG